MNRTLRLIMCAIVVALLATTLSLGAFSRPPTAHAAGSAFTLPSSFIEAPMPSTAPTGGQDPANGQQYPYWFTFGGHQYLIVDGNYAYDPSFLGGGAYVPRDPKYLGGYGSGQYVWRLQDSSGQLSAKVGIDINTYHIVMLQDSTDHGAVLNAAVQSAGQCADATADPSNEDPALAALAADFIAWCGAGGAFVAVFN